MRRILLVLSVAALMAAMMVASAMPVFAKPAQKPGQFTCYNFETGQQDRNVPRGQTGEYPYYDPNFGGYCYPQV
jgi:hypothetical protein